MTYNPYQDNQQFDVPPPVITPQKKGGGCGCMVLVVFLILLAAGWGTWKYMLNEQVPDWVPGQETVTESPAPTPTPGHGGKAWGTKPTN